MEFICCKAQADDAISLASCEAIIFPQGPVGSFVAVDDFIGSENNLP